VPLAKIPPGKYRLQITIGSGIDARIRTAPLTWSTEVCGHLWHRTSVLCFRGTDSSATLAGQRH
jgi:hypothetical protein